MKKLLLSLSLFTSLSGFSQTITKDNSVAGGNSTVFDILVQSDGKIVVAGGFTYMNGSSALYIDRYNADGTPSTFASGAGNNTTSGTNDYITCLKELSNGDILVGGNFTRFDTQVQSRIAKIDADGFPVSSFVPGVGQGFNDLVNSIDVQSDGKIIVGGLFTDYAGNTANRIARLTANGAYDNTFSIGTGFDAKVNKIKVLANDKILVAGDFTSYNGTAVEGLVILNADGTLNTDFNLDGASIVSGGNVKVRNFEIQSDGKILIVPFIGGGRVYRINLNGTVDFSFTPFDFNTAISAICIQPDGKVIVSGQFTLFQNTIPVNRILRLNTNGSLDNTFTVGTGLNSRAFAIKVQSDNKILVGGEFTDFDGETMNYFGRLNNCSVNTTVSLIYNGGLNGQNSLSAVQTNASYQWVDCNNGNTDISGQTSMTYAPTVSGSYAVKITTEECQVTSDCKSFYFCPLSNAVTLSGNTISVTTIPAQQPVFEWYADCDTENPIAGATLSSFTPTASGNYSVSIGSNWEECNVISDCIYVGLAGLEENQQTSFSIYPNPANENVTISNIEVGSTVTLVDVSGKSVSQQFSNSTSVKLQTSALTSGVYFVHVMNNNGISGTQKLVIE
jgi:uncharacterized delta-60 repeat protein